MTPPTSLRHEIENKLDEMLVLAETNNDNKKETADDILKLIKKRIDKVERDYKKALTPWGQQQPMKEMYPKEMNALERVRKELLIGINDKKK